jgi:hypothetical protein
VNDARQQLLDERNDALELLQRATECLHVVRPSTLRTPLLGILKSKIALIQAHSTILGLSVVYVIELAQELVNHADDPENNSEQHAAS